MQQPHRRAILVCAAIVASALIFSLAVRPMVSIRGGVGPVLGFAEAPLWASVWLAVCLALSTAIACVVGRLVNAVVGMFVLGCGVGLLAMRSGTIRDFAFAEGRVIDLAIEGFLWAIVVLAVSTIVFRLSGPLPDQPPIDDPRTDGPLGTKGFLAQSAGVLVLPVVWLIAVAATKGQALGATVVGGMIVGLAGRLIAPRTPPVLLFAAPMVFGSIGYILAHLMLPAGQSLDALFVARSLPRLAYPMPVDYAAGSMAGVALGIGWARSFLKPHPATA